ncbi:MAG: riboflavin synthase, partial [Pseudomonadota bacterium]|nr:riboflavin synthase [Pseudomonadota bacterium]
MFTGIVQAIGQLARKDLLGIDARVLVQTPSVFAVHTVQLGDSIAVNGVCLTVIQVLDNSGFWADVSAETLACTTLNELALNSPVHLEKALTPQTPLGGHIVNGHVDGIGLVTQAYHDGRSLRLTLQAPQALAKYIAPKGSITLDGISLT